MDIAAIVKLIIAMYVVDKVSLWLAKFLTPGFMMTNN